MTARPNLRAHLDGLAERSPSASGSAGVSRFSSVAVPLADACATANTLVRVREDIAGFAGGQVWRLDWCPRVVASGARHLAVECRAGNNVEHHFDRLGEGRGPALVQVWALRPRDPRANAPRASGTDAATKRKRDRTRPADAAPTDEDTSSASAVLGLAHEGGYALDLRWCRSLDALGRASAGASLDYSPSPWATDASRYGACPSPSPSPRRRTILRTRQSRTRQSSRPPSRTSALRRPSTASRSRSTGAPGRRATDSSREPPAGTSSCGSCRGSTPPGLGTVRARSPSAVLSAGCPQRAVACPPEDDEDDQDDEASEDLSHLILSAGHCMKEPALWDARDPFSPVSGRRGEAFAGGFFQLSAAWLREGRVVTGSDNGEVALHDPFHPARFECTRKDAAERTKRRLVGDASEEYAANASATSANASASSRGACVGGGRQGNHGRSRRLFPVAAATGSKGLRVAMTCAAGAAAPRESGTSSSRVRTAFPWISSASGRRDRDDGRRTSRGDALRTKGGRDRSDRGRRDRGGCSVRAMVATARAGGDSRGGRRARGRRSLVGVGRRLGIRSVSEIRRRGARDRRGGARPNLVTRGGSGTEGGGGVANDRGWRTNEEGEGGERPRAANERERRANEEGANDRGVRTTHPSRLKRKRRENERRRTRNVRRAAMTRRRDAPPRRASPPPPRRLPVALPSNIFLYQKSSP